MIGAIVNFVDPRTNADRIKHFCNITNSKVLVSFDMINDKINSIIDETKVDNVVTVSIADSLSLVKGALYNKSQKNNIKDI